MYVSYMFVSEKNNLWFNMLYYKVVNRKNHKTL